MTVKQRQNKIKHDYLVKLIGYGCTVEQIVKETRKSELHVNNMIEIYRL
jgi:hypothetical protein